MRHLEVRWQLFDEALSRFGDLESMLAICAEKARWKHYTADGVKEAHITEDLKSLIDRKLSMVVSINSITQLFASGELGTSFGDEISKNGVQVQAALDLFNETRQDWSRIERNYVLEQDTYVLCNHKVHTDLFPVSTSHCHRSLFSSNLSTSHLFSLPIYQQAIVRDLFLF